VVVRQSRARGAVALLCGAATIVAACGRDRAPARDSAALAASTVVAAGSGRQGPLCPRSGHWSECTIRIRLEQSGLAPQPTTDKVGDLPPIPGTPTLYHIGNAGVALYLFKDTLARHGAAATLDTAKFIAPSVAVGIHGEATAIQSDNLLALLFSRNEHQRERVSDAITAGPPQP
jgi:hypothetical protein